MVKTYCIACGNEVARVRSCSCGHVIAEDLIVVDVTTCINHRLRRNSEKRTRKLTAKLKPMKNAKSYKSEVRNFFLSKDKDLRRAGKSNKRPSILRPMNISQKRKGLLLLEERKRKILHLLSSPRYQMKMKITLEQINNKLLRQNTFYAILEQDSNRRHLRVRPIKS